MSKQFDYTSRARKVSAKHPFFSYLLTQINFWVIANLMLGILSYLQIKSVLQNVDAKMEISLLPFLLLGLSMGIFFGSLIGLSNYILDRKFYGKQSLGILLFIKLIIGLTVLSLVFLLVRYFLYDNVVRHLMPVAAPEMRADSWKYLIMVLLIFYGFTSIMINFINQIQNKFGPGVLIPILFGKYSKPKEEERIFLFMDLKSSTTIAESLGHLQYSSLIRDAIFDINRLLPKYDAEVYQYVGDEIVITWKTAEGLEDLNCAHFFFACQHQFEQRRDYYMQQYGQIPFFKAGMNMGTVSAVEIGDIKRDIAYHGDTINIAARIQSQCNVVGRTFLCSAIFRDFIQQDSSLYTEEIGSTLLKGKTKNISIISVGRKMDL